MSDTPFMAQRKKLRELKAKQDGHTPDALDDGEVLSEGLGLPAAKKKAKKKSKKKAG